jgi:uncharacterized protein YbcI
MSITPQDDGRGRVARPGAERGEMLMEVSNAVVRIHKHFYGKGPTKARAHLSQDLLAVVLEGGFTRGEETLQERGHESEVLRARILMQHSVEAEFRAAIERIVGRSVRSFMSANDPATGLQAEIFVFEPVAAQEGPEEPTVGEVEGKADVADETGSDSVAEPGASGEPELASS